jgi:integrase
MTKAPKALNGDAAVRTVIDKDDNKRYIYQLMYTDALTKERHRINFSSKDQQEVIAFKNKTMTDIRNGKFVDKSTLTVGLWVRQWLDEYKKGSVAETTWLTYDTIFRTHIVPSLGKHQIQQLQPRHIQKMIGKLKGYSKSIIVQSIVILKGSLKQAVLERYIPSNPALSVVLPRFTEKKTEAIPRDDLIRLIRVAQKHSLYPALMLLLATGIRRGELLGLKWSNVDFENSSVTISQQIVKLGGKSQVSTLKTGSSYRTIPVPKDTLKLLRDIPKTSEFIFVTSKGTTINPRNFNRTFDGWCSKAGIKAHLHMTRSTFATDMIDQGESIKTVQGLTGHATARMLTDKYAHVVPKSTREAAERLNGRLQTLVTTSESVTLLVTTLVSTLVKIKSTKAANPCTV